MKDGARWHKLYAGLSKPDDDGSPQHPRERPLSGIPSSFNYHDVTIRPPRDCYALGRGRRTAPFKAPHTLAVRHVIGARSNSFNFLKTDQMSRGNASAIFFPGYLFGLTHTYST